MMQTAWSAAGRMYRPNKPKVRAQQAETSGKRRLGFMLPPSGHDIMPRARSDAFVGGLSGRSSLPGF